MFSCSTCWMCEMWVFYHFLWWLEDFGRGFPLHCAAHQQSQQPEHRFFSVPFKRLDRATGLKEVSQATAGFDFGLISTFFPDNSYHALRTYHVPFTVLGACLFVCLVIIHYSQSLLYPWIIHVYSSQSTKCLLSSVSSFLKRHYIGHYCTKESIMLTHSCKVTNT